MLSISLRLITIAAYIIGTEFRNRFNVNQDFQREYDFIIVGSGSAGAIVAHRLAESGTKVLLLEAGPPNGIPNDIPLLNGNLVRSQYDWNYTILPQFVGKGYSNGRIFESRGKVLGGSSSTNGMTFIRGNRRDFNRWQTEFGANGWSYENVLQFFMRYENNTDPNITSNGFHGTNGPVQISSWANPDTLMLVYQRAMNEIGYPTIDINGPEQTGTAIAQATIDSRGVRSSTANAYLDPNPFPENLHIIVRAFVTKILFNKNTAKGVQFFRKGDYYEVMARKEVIVSAGAINSPQLLMLSGIGPRKHLESINIPVLMDLAVGQHMQNHASTNIDFLIRDEYQNTVINGDPVLTVDRLYEYFVDNSGDLTNYYFLATLMSTHNHLNKEWPNCAVEAVINRFTSRENFNSNVYERSEEWADYFTDFYGKNYFVAYSLLVLPRSYGYLKLVSSNPFVHPEFTPRSLADPQDFYEMQEMVKFVFFFYERSSFASYIVPHRPIPGCQFCANQRFVYECDTYIRCLIIQIVISGYHSVGTCRMGDVRRKDTVVDPRLRVKGINRLRVCDASIMPLVTNANTNAPSMMIGEKCSQLVKEDNRLIAIQY